MITEFTLPFIAFALGVAGCAGMTPIVRRWSSAHGFVDRPGGHKGQDAPVALGGGVAVTLAVILPIGFGVLLAWGVEASPPDWMPPAILPHLSGMVSKMPVALAICGAAVVMCLLGLVDDCRPLPPGLRLIIQTAVAAFLVIGWDLKLLSHLPAAVSIALSILWIVTLTNSLNFLDNMDGLATGVVLIAATIFGIAAMRAGQVFVPTCCWLLAGALLGFLPFNFHPAGIYLGDAGSTVIGLLLAVFTILTTFTSPARGQEPIGVIAPLLVIAVPLYDTASVFYLRFRSGIPIWTADRRHFSHRLVRRGMGVRKAVLVIWLATLVTALPVLLLPHASWPVAWGIVLQTLLVVILVALLESAGPNGKA